MGDLYALASALCFGISNVTVMLANPLLVLDELMYLVFPGYFDEENFDELLSTYVVGERCARLYHDLTAVCYRAFRVQQHDCDSEQRKDIANAIGHYEQVPPSDEFFPAIARIVELRVAEKNIGAAQ